MEKENQIIEAIIQRIKDEEKKHSKSVEDWHRIAANKIYATFDIKIKEKMSNKQSSIEWLVEMTSKLGYVSVDIVEQAKEMHKQEMNKCWDEAKKSFSDEEFEK